NILRINERGIREGLILKGLSRHDLLAASAASNWREAVEKLAHSCHVDMAHAEQTRRHAVILFDMVAKRFALGERERDLLEAAAILHDIGYFINYAKHHKHSYHLIRHATLFDFSPREKELIANLARYHRKSLPKSRHENYHRLSADDQALVMKLGGILRLADGLDRRRTQQVKTLTGRLGDILDLSLTGEGGLAVEVHGGVSKADLFERAFACPVHIAEMTGKVD
ncbi:MAG: Ppx/GppA family phosphatase, partial [Desulfuromonas sp.]